MTKQSINEVFEIRNALAETLKEIMDADPRVNSNDFQAELDMAEELMKAGWVNV